MYVSVAGRVGLVGGSYQANVWGVCLYTFVFFLYREPIGLDMGKGMLGAQELCQTLKS